MAVRSYDPTIDIQKQIGTRRPRPVNRSNPTKSAEDKNSPTQRRKRNLATHKSTAH